MTLPTSTPRLDSSHGQSRHVHVDPLLEHLQLLLPTLRCCHWWPHVAGLGQTNGSIHGRFESMSPFISSKVPSWSQSFGDHWLHDLTCGIWARSSSNRIGECGTGGPARDLPAPNISNGVHLQLIHHKKAIGRWSFPTESLTEYDIPSCKCLSKYLESSSNSCLFTLDSRIF